MKTKTIKIVGLIAMMLGTVVMMDSCSKKPDAAAMQAAMGAPSYGVMTVSEGNSESELSFPATIKGKTDIDIRPQVSGFITKVHVDEGQVVRKGQPLFTIDQVQYRAAVDQAEAAVNSARTAVSNAELTAQNKRQLFDRNIISQYEWQMADNALQTARAQLASAEAALVSARRNLSYTTVTAPSNGVVGTIPNREGSLASPSSAQPLTTVSDISDVYAYFSLTERDILELTNNGERSLNAAIASMPEVGLRLADGTLYSGTGKVATVSGVIDPATGAASVRALFHNPSGMLRSGSTGNVVLPKNRSNVITIPQRATFELQDRTFVYVVGDSNKVASVPITVERVSDGATYVVTSGLQPGQRIVVEGVGLGSNLRDGMVITPVAPGQQPVDPRAAAAAAGH